MWPLLLLLRPAREIKTKITENRAIQRVNVVAVTSDKQTEPRHAQHILHFHFRMHKKKKTKTKYRQNALCVFLNFVFSSSMHTELLCTVHIHLMHAGHGILVYKINVAESCAEIAYSTLRMVPGAL